MRRTQDVAGQDGGLAGLAARRDALRQAAALGGADLAPTLDAALAELDAAIEALGASQAGPAAGADAASGALHAERRLLRAVFTDAPVPLLLAERDGTVRRANRAAGDLLGTGSGYATGRPLTAFVNLPSRAAVDSQLAAVSRTGQTRQIRCELLTGTGTADCELTIGVARLRGDADQLIIAVSQFPPPGGGPPDAAGRTAAGKKAAARTPAARAAAGGATAGRKPAGPGLAAAMTRRLDLATAVSRLLLENAPVNETVAVQRCARLLADELAAWVIVDVARGRRLRRQSVVGGEDERSAELARVVAAGDPPPGSLPHSVHDLRGPQLIARVEDTGVLGESPDGVPLLMLLGATSLLSVPLSDGDRCYGALTLARLPSAGTFELADLGLVAEIGGQLALAITMDRRIRQRTEAANALRDSLLPRELPGVPGVQIATAHLATTQSPGLGGDYFGVYRTRTGWGVVIGDAGGRGEEVPAISAAARHAIRSVAHATDDPAEVLTRANEILLAEEFGGRFVTACTAHLSWRDAQLAVAVGSAGHPPPLVLHPDGAVVQLRGGGLPLGIFPDAGPALEEHCLSAGDVLLFYSDGLADARGRDRDDFGDRLPGEVAALAGQAPRQILARLQELALDFCHGQVRDDIILLALGVGEPPGENQGLP
jgi:serine phosphatase RsbU (regulator of sigma subunit)/PAS domain-containing protein